MTTSDASSSSMLLHRNSPEFPGPHRPRASSNASSCGGRLSPFRTRTLSNASSSCNDFAGGGGQLQQSPPNGTPEQQLTTEQTLPLSPWSSGSAGGGIYRSPNSTFGYGDANNVVVQSALHEALRQIKLEEQDPQQQQQQQQQQQEEQQQQQQQQLSEEDCLRLLDLTLKPEDSQMLLDALCASEEGSGIVESMVKCGQLQPEQVPTSAAMLPKMSPPSVIPVPVEESLKTELVESEDVDLSPSPPPPPPPLPPPPPEEVFLEQQQHQSVSSSPRDGHKIKVSASIASAARSQTRTTTFFLVIPQRRKYVTESISQSSKARSLHVPQNFLPT